MTFSMLRTIGARIFPPTPLMCRKDLWRKTLHELRVRGEGRRESGGFLLGVRQGEQRTIRMFVPYDEIDPASLRGMILFDGSKIDQLWNICKKTGLQVVADVHTHPAGYGQSSVDQANPMLPERGHIALIVPNYAGGNYGPGRIGIYQYFGRDGWVNQTAKGSTFFSLRWF